MAQSKGWTATLEKSWGDVAVDWLLSGMAAGLVMAAYVLVAAWLGGEGPGVVLGRFDLTAGRSPLTGGLLHLATAAIYGLVFAFLLRSVAAVWRAAPRFAWVLGLAYGLGLFALAWLWFVPVGSPLRGVGAAHFAAGHALYGAVLGFLVGRHLAR
jgi:hypothetical protein